MQYVPPTHPTAPERSFFFLLKFPFKISEFPFFPISDILLKSKLDTEGYKMVPFFFLRCVNKRLKPRIHIPSFLGSVGTKVAW